VAPWRVPSGAGLVTELAAVCRTRAKQICQAFGLPYERQDWGSFNADGQRLSAFMAYYESNPLSETQKFELGELILASVNERLISKKSLPGALLPFLTRHWRVLETQLEYWQRL
jgi:hypothetical protein